MSGIAIIVGHARKDTFCEALGEAYQRGAEAGRYQATLFVTSRMTFDPVLHEGFTRLQPLEPDLQAAHDAIIAADHVVFILWGSYAQKKAQFVDRQKHLVIESVHPSPLSSYRGFFGSKPFSKANRWLEEKKIKPISWCC